MGPGDPTRGDRMGRHRLADLSRSHQGAVPLVMEMRNLLSETANPFHEFARCRARGASSKKGDHGRKLRRIRTDKVRMEPPDFATHPQSMWPPTSDRGNIEGKALHTFSSHAQFRQP